MRSGTVSRIGVGILVLSVGFGSVGCSCSGSNDSQSSPATNEGVIKPVWDWIVGFATGIGGYVKDKAADFAEALQRAWLAFFQKYSDVVQDKNDPKKGIFAGILKCEVAWGKKLTNKLHIELDHPRMHRSEVGAEWELDQSARERIEDLHRQLLKSD